MISRGPELLNTSSSEFLEVQPCGYQRQRANLLMQLIAESNLLAKYKNPPIREDDLGLGCNKDTNGRLELGKIIWKCIPVSF